MQLTADQIQAIEILKRRVEEANVGAHTIKLAMDSLKEIGITADVKLKQEGSEAPVFTLSELSITVSITDELIRESTGAIVVVNRDKDRDVDAYFASRINEPRGSGISLLIDDLGVVCFICNEAQCICARYGHTDVAANGKPTE